MSKRSEFCLAGFVQLPGYRQLAPTREGLVLGKWREQTVLLGMKRSVQLEIDDFEGPILLRHSDKIINNQAGLHEWSAIVVMMTRV